MMKAINKLLLLAVVFTMILGLCACNNNEQKPTEPSRFVPVDGAPEATTYIIDSWREDKEDGTRDYFIKLLSYSDDYYAELSSEDVVYKTESGYEQLSATVDGAIVDIYNYNAESKEGIASLILIKTNKMIDEKKVYVRLSGPTKYEDGVKTREDYVEKHGSADGWVSKLTSITEKTPPYSNIVQKYTSATSGPIMMISDGYNVYNFALTDDEPIINETTHLKRIELTAVSTRSIEDFIADISMCSLAYKATDDNGNEVWKFADAKFQAYGEIINGQVYIGYKMADDSKIADAGVPLPEAFLSQYDETMMYEFYLN